MQHDRWNNDILYRCCDDVAIDIEITNRTRAKKTAWVPRKSSVWRYPLQLHHDFELDILRQLIRYL